MGLEVMIDLETMGTRPDAAPVAIGAVKFDPLGEPGSMACAPFYRSIDLDSCLEVGLTVGGDTVRWWLGQSAEARAALKFDTRLDFALQIFRHWFGFEPLPVWGNGAAFDCVILRTAFERCRVAAPWGFRDERCYRTIAAEHPEVARPSPAVAHHAAHDAAAQAAHLQAIRRKKNLVTPAA